MKKLTREQNRRLIDVGNQQLKKDVNRARRTIFKNDIFKRNRR